MRSVVRPVLRPVGRWQAMRPVGQHAAPPAVRQVWRHPLRSRQPAPHVYFLVSAVFHYLGPAFAVLLFARVAPLGVAWLRIVSAALVFAVVRRPWRVLRPSGPAGVVGRPVRGSATRNRVWLYLGLGLTLAAMNCVFYLAIDRLPLATVGAIEFVGPLVLAAVGVRAWRNAAALVLAVAGVALLAKVRLTGDPLGFGLAVGNCALFTCYIVLGKRIAADGGAAGIDRLGLSMLIAAVAVSPVGLADVRPVLTDPLLLAAGVGVGVCSSVIPYVCDQLAMARMPRATFALMLALLPATATAIGVIVLRQMPGLIEILGIGCVVAAVALHRPDGGGSTGGSGGHAGGDVPDVVVAGRPQ